MNHEEAFKKKEKTGLGLRARALTFLAFRRNSVSGGSKTAIDPSPHPPGSPTSPTSPTTSPPTSPISFTTTTRQGGILGYRASVDGGSRSGANGREEFKPGHRRTRSSGVFGIRGLGLPGRNSDDAIGNRIGNGGGNGDNDNSNDDAATKPKEKTLGGRADEKAVAEEEESRKKSRPRSWYLPAAVISSAKERWSGVVAASRVDRGGEGGGKRRGSFLARRADRLELPATTTKAKSTERMEDVVQPVLGSDIPSSSTAPVPQDNASTSVQDYPQVAQPLQIIVVGGGIGGLAAAFLLGRAGHKVTVLEAASEFKANVGAGIQLSPNVTRLLIRWGLGEKLKEVAVVPQALTLRRYEDGDVVGWTRWGELVEKEHGAPYYHVHRGDLIDILHAAASPVSTLLLNSRVTSLDPSTPSVTLASGRTLTADLVIGADGLHSRVRPAVVNPPPSPAPAPSALSELIKDLNLSEEGEGGGDAAAVEALRLMMEEDENKDPSRPRPTGDAAYRATVPTSKMREDEELGALVEEGGVTVWMGPGRHIVGYCIRNKELYNLVIVYPAREANEEVRETSVEVMRADFEMFEPRVRKLLELVETAKVWSLMDRQPLDTWVHPDGKVCLLGDACHPMLPYRAQGAAMALEDAAVLANLLTKTPPSSHPPPTPTMASYTPAFLATHPSSSPMLSSPLATPSAPSPSFPLSALLEAYERLRHPRATQTQAASRLNQHIFHLPDGPKQRERDASMRAAMEVAVREEEERVVVAAALASNVAGGATTVGGAGQGGVGGEGEGQGEQGRRQGQAEEGSRGNMNQWADREKTRVAYGYDADEEVRKWWESLQVRLVTG